VKSVLLCLSKTLADIKGTSLKLRGFNQLYKLYRSLIMVIIKMFIRVEIGVCPLCQLYDLYI